MGSAIGITLASLLPTAIEYAMQYFNKDKIDPAEAYERGRQAAAESDIWFYLFVAIVGLIVAAAFYAFHTSSQRKKRKKHRRRNRKSKAYSESNVSDIDSNCSSSNI